MSKSTRSSTIDGSQLYFIEAQTGDLGVYDVEMGSVTPIGPVTLDGVPVGPALVLAAFSADGALVVANNNDDGLYTVDTGNGVATRLGTIVDIGTGFDVDVLGADLAFGSDGTLYLWSNSTTSRGLWELEFPVGEDGIVDAVFVGEDSAAFFTGMAVRDGGAGDLVVSARPSDGVPSSIDQISRTDASLVATFVMYLDEDADGQPDSAEPYVYSFGDMTIGELCVGDKPPHDHKPPDIEITKTADPTTLPANGGTVTFTFVVTNVGEVDVALRSLTDSVFGDLNGQGDCVTRGVIPVGGSYRCSISEHLDGHQTEQSKGGNHETPPHENVVDAKACTQSSDHHREDCDRASDSASVTFSKDKPPECVARSTLYLTDSRSSSEDSLLFEVVPDDDGLLALLQPLVELDGYVQVDVLASTIDGSQLYFIEAQTGDLGVYDVEMGSVTPIGPVTLDGVPVGPALVLAAFSADGALVVANNNDDGLYTVDTGNGVATRLGTIVDIGTGFDVDVLGADLAFGSDGTLYLWSNSTTSRGLWELEFPVGEDGIVDAVFVGEDSAAFFTGMAVRDGGAGDLVVSARPSDGVPSSIDQISRTDASLVATFVMYLDEDADGQPDSAEPYVYSFGDMTIGELCVGDKPPHDHKPPDIEITKTADPTTLPANGGTVTFTFVVTNVGEVDVALRSLTDSVFGDLNGQGDCVTRGVIPVGGSYRCSISEHLDGHQTEQSKGGNHETPPHENVVDAKACTQSSDHHREDCDRASDSASVTFSKDKPPECVARSTLYLTDSRSSSEDSLLFEVVPDDDGLLALLQPLVELDGYVQVDALASTIDGSQLYFIEAQTGDLGVYDVEMGSVTPIGPVTLDGVPVGPALVLAAFSADGALVVANNNDDGLYTVDTGNGVATRLGTIVDIGTGFDVDVLGADLAFGSDGTLYLWSNSTTSRGLWELEFPVGEDGIVDAVFVGEDSAAFFTGMAVRDGGAGDLVVSARPSDGVPSSIDQISRTDASLVATFVMYLDEDADGQPDSAEPYVYSFGDMTIGELCVGDKPPHDHKQG